MIGKSCSAKSDQATRLATNDYGEDETVKEQPESENGAALSRRALEVQSVRRVTLPDEYPDTGGSPDGNPGQQLIGRLLEHKLLMAVTLVLMSSIGVAAVWLGVAPAYRATASIEVSARRSELVEGRGERIENYESFRLSQVDHLTRPEVLKGVLAHPAVQKTGFYRDEPCTEVQRIWRKLGLYSPQPVEERLVAALSATAPARRQYVYVTMNCSSPGEAKTILDVVVQEYKRFSDNLELQREDVRLSKLLEKINECEREIQTRSKALDEVYTRLRTRSLETILAARRQKLDDWLVQLSEINHQLAAMERVNSAEGGPATSRPALESDPEWRRLNDLLLKAQADVESAATLGELHPGKIRFDRELARIQQRIREFELVSTQRVASGLPVNPQEASLGVLRIRAEALQRQIEEGERKYNEQFEDSEFAFREEEKVTGWKADKTRYERDARKIEDDRQLAGIVTPYEAAEPSSPAEDKRFKLSLAAVCGAFGAAVLLAFVRVRATTHVQDAEVELGRSGGRILGRLPLRPQAPALVRMEPEYAEPLRVVRTTLLHTLRQDHGQVVQITSAETNSGKTTVATHLARSTALVGKRVLLVDADLHRVSLSKRLQAGDRGGLIQALQNGNWKSQIVPDANVENLSILPAGRRATNVQAELLANGRLTRMADEWREEFDLVIIDSPPLFGPADALILSGAVDGTIMIVRERHCQLRAVRGAMEAIGQAGGRLLGTVVIGDPRKSHPYYYGYQYGYGQGGDVTEEARGADDSPKHKN